VGKLTPPTKFDGDILMETKKVRTCTFATFNKETGLIEVCGELTHPNYFFCKKHHKQVENIEEYSYSILGSGNRQSSGTHKYSMGSM